MLSLILSRLFRIAFIIALIIGTAQVWVQVTQRPLQVGSGKFSTAGIGQPGIFFQASRINMAEMPAPDTSIHFQRFGGPGRLTVSTGTLPLGMQAEKQHMLEESKIMGDSMLLDTVYHLLLNRGNVEYFPGTDKKTGSLTTFNNLPDGKVIIETQKFNADNHKEISTNTFDTVNGMVAAKIKAIKGPGQDINIKEEVATMTETLRLLPASRLQQAWFICFDVLMAASVILLMLVLARLFRNFYKKDYFSIKNFRIIRTAGLLLLIPQFVKLVNYWLLLVNIHPVKAIVNSNTAEASRELAYYSSLSDINWSYVFLAAGLIILSHIFSRGLQLEEKLSNVV